jgi:excisionase family DNA binding protein
MGAGVETYFTIDELAKYLNYAEKTIRKWVLNREIPFHKIHKTIRFRLSEIEKWIDNSGVLSATMGVNDASSPKGSDGLFDETDTEEIAENRCCDGL